MPSIKTLYVEREAAIDAATAVSGSGPAYIFYFMDAMMQAARSMGFSPSESELLVTQTFQGDGYTLTNVYSLRKDGKTLALQITYAHPKLNNPFSYKLVFGKNN